MSCFAHLDGSTFLLISLNILTYTPLLVIIHIGIGNACMYMYHQKGSLTVEKYSTSLNRTAVKQDQLSPKHECQQCIGVESKLGHVRMFTMGHVRMFTMGRVRTFTIGRVLCHMK